MDLAWLETFLAVARRGGFTAAATERGLTQPGASRQVQKLEQAVGTPLLERAAGGVRLTPAGARFRDYAEAAVAANRAILDEIRGDAGDAAGEAPPLTGALRIAASSTPGEFLVPGLVAAFVARHPGVRPEVAIADSAAVAAEVRARRAEVGFVGARLGERGLRYRPVAADEVVLAVPAGHPFAARGEIALGELAGQALLEREGGSGTAASVRRVLAARGLAVPAHRTVMTLGTSQAIVSAVERGYGVGWVSSIALAGRDPGRVVPVRLAGVPLRRVLSLVVERGRALPPVAAAFVAAVDERSGKTPDD